MRNAFQIIGNCFGQTVESYNAFDSIKPEKTTQIDLGMQYKSGRI